MVLDRLPLAEEEELVINECQEFQQDPVSVEEEIKSFANLPGPELKECMGVVWKDVIEPLGTHDINVGNLILLYYYYVVDPSLCNP